MSTTRRRLRAPWAAVLAAAVLAGCAPAAAQPVAPAVATMQPSQVPTPRPTPEPTPLVTPSPTVRPTPVPTPTPTPTPEPQPFALNLFEEGDFVPQHTFDWCVGASIQMAWNLVRSDRRSSYEDQQAIWEMARARSSNSFRGANPRGWAAVLTELGLGEHEFATIPDYTDALRAAARALRETNRPVGLVMWRGRHAWVMSGFTSIGDPAIHDDFTVTGIYVLDPLYPHGSASWGPSPAPNSLLAPEELAKQFVIREPRRWTLGMQAGYPLVLPLS